MTRHARKRQMISIMFLAVMAVNFGAEGFSLYSAHGFALFESAKSRLCSVPDGPASCCAEKPATACGCPCCGDSCPMGDACTCGDDGKSKAFAGGLFFQMPGCHPDQAAHNSSYLPLSMRLVFLEATKLPPGMDFPQPHIIDSRAGRPGVLLPPPPVPPPRYATA